MIEKELQLDTNVQFRKHFLSLQWLNLKLQKIKFYPNHSSSNYRNLQLISQNLIDRGDYIIGSVV